MELRIDHYSFRRHLSQAVEDQDGKPRTQEAPIGIVPKRDQGAQSEERYYAAMREYQHDNTRLYFLITPSFNFQGPWEQNDIEMIQRDYTKKLLRDGNGILQWFISAVTMVR